MEDRDIALTIVSLKEIQGPPIPKRLDEAGISALGYAAGQRMRRDDMCSSRFHNSASDILSNSLTPKSWLSYTRVLPEIILNFR
jgi:hypothetical protein